MLVMNTRSIHHNEKYWKDPLLFDPDRWKQEPEPFTYMPFGAGVRACLGQRFAVMELTIFLIMVFQRYSLKVDSNYEITEKWGITVEPGNLHVYFIPRK